MKNKIIVSMIAFVVLIFAGTLISIFIHQKSALRSFELLLRGFEDEVTNISLPKEIEKIAIKSGIGDSGGNGDYLTLRVVLVVKTDLNINELEETIKKIHFLNYGRSSDNTPIFYITRCESSVFQSRVQFALRFDERLVINDYSNYFFIEFIQ